MLFRAQYVELGERWNKFSNILCQVQMTQIQSDFDPIDASCDIIKVQ